MAKKTATPKLIALTGATGFVGGRIMHAALEAGHHVKALTRRPVKPIKNVTWVKGDLDNHEALADLFVEADAFIHTAGLVKAKTKEDFFRVNEGAVENLMDLAAKAKLKKGFHFLLVSSLAARHPDLSPYAESKRAGELAISKADPTFPWTILRPPAVYGPGDKEILKLFRAMKRGFAPVAGDDENRFSLIHADDLARAIVSAVSHKKAFGQTLEPDDGRKDGYTIHTVARVAESVLERKIRTFEIPGPILTLFAGANELVAKFSSEPAILSRHKVREMTHPNWVSDVKTLENLQGWKPTIDLETGFQETVSWYQKEGLL